MKSGISLAPALILLFRELICSHRKTHPDAMALLIFFAFAMQCTSTLAVVRRKTNSWARACDPVCLYERGTMAQRWS